MTTKTMMISVSVETNQVLKDQAARERKSLKDYLADRLTEMANTGPVQPAPATPPPSVPVGNEH